MAENEKNVKIENLHGIYMMGTLEGVDFRASGNYEGKPFPAKVTLNFSVPFENKQVIKGVEIASMAKRSQLITLSTSDDYEKNYFFVVFIVYKFYLNIFID